MGLKYRNEYKAVLDGARLGLIEKALRGLCIPDSHAGEDGRYKVKSLYFDTPDRRCYLQTLDGVDDRAKYRIRIYDNSPDFISLERKESLRGKKRKLTQRISRRVFDSIVNGDSINEEGEVLNRFLADAEAFRLEGIAVIEYDRTSFTHPAGNVRVTFDRNISAYRGDLFSVNPSAVPVMFNDMHVLEVKFDEVLPGAIKSCLDAYGIEVSSFSKYVHGIDALSGIMEGDYR